MTVVRLALALVIMSWGTEQASAQLQPQGPLPSPKGDGSVMNPMREMQRHSLERGIQGLNERAARRAAVAGTARSPTNAPASQAPAR